MDGNDDANHEYQNPGDFDLVAEDSASSPELEGKSALEDIPDPEQEPEIEMDEEAMKQELLARLQERLKHSLDFQADAAVGNEFSGDDDAL
jgi:hypothetical protein